MPANPRRRRPTRRSVGRLLQPGEAPAPRDEPVERAPTAGLARRTMRPARAVEHDTPFVLAELRRIGLVTLATGGLLVALVVVDRLQ
jgi:hypothetical protein